MHHTTSLRRELLAAFAIVFAGFFFSSRRRHTRWTGDWSSDVCSSDLVTSRNRLPSLAGAHLTELDMLSTAEATRLLAQVAGEQRINANLAAAEQIVARCGEIGRASCRERVQGCAAAAKSNRKISESEM